MYVTRITKPITKPIHISFPRKSFCWSNFSFLVFFSDGCVACGYVIKDKYIWVTDNKCYHFVCIRCSMCDVSWSLPKVTLVLTLTFFRLHLVKMTSVLSEMAKFTAEQIMQSESKLRFIRTERPDPFGR